MKLAYEETGLTTSKEFVNQAFGVGDAGVLFEILRSKMYSNKIRAICQEISSNARDAHREVGKPNIPIEITLPTVWDSTYTVRDFGPGITPDRMMKVFIQYGASTKRSDNLQTGGFGLGAKCPFSYTDSFLIETITPESNFEQNGVTHKDVLVKRIYSAVIDDSRMGKIFLCNEPEITTEAQGTAIKIPVESKDFFAFKDWTDKSCQYWSVRPVIHGDSNFVWTELPTGPKIGDEVLWVSYSKPNHAKGCVILLDEIPYELNTSHIESEDSDTIHSFVNTTTFLKFKTGELPVTASREDIDYTDDAKSFIHGRLTLLRMEFIKELQAEIDKLPNLWEAMCLYYQTRKNIRLKLPVMLWNGFKLEERITFGGETQNMLINYTSSYGTSYRDTFSKNPSASFGVLKKNERRFFIQNVVKGKPEKIPYRRICKLIKREQCSVTVFMSDKLTADDWKIIKHLPIESFDILPKLEYNKQINPVNNTQIRVYTISSTGSVSVTYLPEDTDFDKCVGYAIRVHRHRLYADDGTDHEIFSGHNLEKWCNAVSVKQVYGVPTKLFNKLPAGIRPLQDRIMERVAKVVEVLNKHQDQLVPRIYGTEMPKYLRILSKKSLQAIQDKDVKELLTIQAQGRKNLNSNFRMLVDVALNTDASIAAMKNKLTKKIEALLASINQKYPLLSLVDEYKNLNSAQIDELVIYLNSK